MPKDEVTKPATRNVEIPARKDETTPSEKMPFKTVNLSSCRVAFSSGVISSFRRFAWRYFVFSRGVVLSFRVEYFCLSAWRYFVFSPGVISSFRLASFRLASFHLALFRLASFHVFAFLYSCAARIVTLYLI